MMFELNVFPSIALRDRMFWGCKIFDFGPI